MDSRQETRYPYHEMEHNIDSSSQDEDVGLQFRVHNFDKFCKATKKCLKCNPSIRGIHHSEHGKCTIHGEHYKIITSKISLSAKLNLSDT